MSSFASRIKRTFFRGLSNHLFCGTHFFAVKRALLTASGLRIGNNTKIVGPIHFGNASDISIGEGCWIGKNLSIHGDGKVVIGDRCDLAPDVSILTGSHRIGDPSRRAGEGISFSITVGDGCWIGSGARITGHTDIGTGSVIGACALVNKSIQPNVVVAGVPAKIIRELEI